MFAETVFVIGILQGSGAAATCMAQPVPPSPTYPIEFDPNSTDPQVVRLVAISTRAPAWKAAIENLSSPDSRAFFEGVAANPIDAVDVFRANRILSNSYRDTDFATAVIKLNLAQSALDQNPAIEASDPSLRSLLYSERAQLEQFYGGTAQAALANYDALLGLPLSQTRPFLRRSAYTNASGLAFQQGSVLDASVYIDRLLADHEAVSAGSIEDILHLRNAQASWYDAMADFDEARRRRIATWNEYSALNSVSVVQAALYVSRSFSVELCQSRKLWNYRAYTKAVAIRSAAARDPSVLAGMGLRRLQDAEHELLILMADGGRCDAGLAAWAMQQLQQPVGTPIGTLPVSGMYGGAHPPPFLLDRQRSGISSSADPGDPGRPLLNSELCSRVFASCDNCLPLRPAPSPFHFQPRSIALVYDGMIRAETPGVIPVSVFAEDGNGNVSTTTDYADSMAYEISTTGSGEENNTIVIRGTNQVVLIPGVYHVRPKVTGSNRLLCETFGDGNTIPVYWTQASDDFVFELVGDCNLNGIDDRLDLASNDDMDIYAPFDLLDCCHVPLCNPDVNGDGVVDQADVDYLVDVIAGQPNPSGVDPDFNHDGGADQGDIDALINSVAGNGCPYESCGF